MRWYNWFIIALMLCVAYSCHEGRSAGIEVNHPMDRLPDDRAGEIVKEAIQFAGSWEKWAAKRNFSFYKNITQLDSSGNEIKTVRQYHQYNLNPHFKARMSWQIGDDEFVIINNGEEAKKYKNGKWLKDDKSKNEAWNSSFGSNYVISMPFKLTDPGVSLVYEGIDSTTVGKPVHALRVDYAKGAGSTGGMHKWWYYFDLSNYDLVANYLDYGEGHSLTTYEEFEDVNGMRIHTKRFSYSSNAAKEKVLLRTIYQNDEMKFDQTFDDKIYKLK